MQSITTKPDIRQEIRQNPSLLVATIASVFVMGLGQLINKQWLKALFFFAIPLLFVGLELGTGSWDKMAAGYSSDYVHYYGKLLAPASEKLGADLSAAIGREVVVGMPQTDAVDAAQIAADQDAGQLGIRADLSGPSTHGWVFSAYMAKCLVAPLDQVDATQLDEKALATLSALSTKLSTPVFAQIAANSDKNPVLDNAKATVYAERLNDLPAGKLIRVKWPVSVETTELGFLIEYYSLDYASAVVGPTPKPGETLYPIRDYGGYISRGIWGLATLGTLVTENSYRGLTIEAFNADNPWASADNSSLLLARGLIACVLLLILALFWILNVLDAWHGRRQLIETGRIPGLGEFFKDLWERAYVWILIAPAALLTAFFILIPFIYSFLCSFTNWTYKVYLIKELVHWQGLKEYFVVFGEPAWLELFFQVFGWTALWAVLSSVTVYILGFAHALVIESPLIKAKRVWRTVLIIPWALPALISLLAFRNMFDKDGLINQILYASGLMKPVSNLLFGIGLEGRADDIIYWLNAPYNGNLAKFVALMVNLWLGAPYFLMLITGIMTTIPADRYEAATIDGANSFQRFRYITLPMVVNATIPAMIMTVTFNFNNFGAMYFLTGGGPDWVLEKLPESLRIWTNSMPGQTDILISWIYKISTQPNAQLYNKAAVYTLFIFLILGIFSVVNMKLTKAFNEDGEE